MFREDEKGRDGVVSAMAPKCKERETNFQALEPQALEEKLEKGCDSLLLELFANDASARGVVPKTNGSGLIYKWE